MNGPQNRTLAIIVTFWPDRRHMTALVRKLSGQAQGIVIVDNTPGEESGHLELLGELARACPALKINRMGKNAGIASAFNAGIETALEGGYRFVYLSDQDSEPAEGMIDGLIDCYEGIQARGVNVGCVCPAFHDATTGRLFNFQAYVPGRYFYRSVPAERARPWMEVITTISSGSLIPCHVLETVGLMKEEYFIDDVDTEWCHRARFHGFHIYGTSSVLLNHRLGDVSFRIWLFGWKPFNLYSPLRLYYRFRNYVLMVRLPHVPLRWSVRAAWYWLGNLYAYGLFAPHRIRNVKAIGWGILDGLIGRSGPCRHEF